ncbi:hypothetical protein LXA43DRAFT_1159967 [Ganoderma leucocontextum]|nr:hypothetical protein LXA43DRAFT_1159967 [Ganoderma leucocontextum]
MAPDLEEFMLDSEFSLGQGYFQSFKDFGRLRSLSIPPNTPLDEHMLRTLSTVTSLQNLTCFIDLSSISTLAFPPEYFEPLLAFSGITSFQVYSFLTEPAIHDDDFARFGAAWPQLATFRVVHNWEFARRYSLDDTVPPTLSGLIELARRCPGLCTFYVPRFNAGIFSRRTRLSSSNTAYVLSRSGASSSAVPQEVFGGGHDPGPCLPCDFPGGRAVSDY